MVAASTSLSRVAYVPETTWGTTPSTPVFQIFRRTSGEMRTRKTTGVSEEVTDNRNVREEFLLGKDPEGSFDFELSYGTLDDFLAAALQGAWSANVLKVGAVRQPFTIEQRLTVASDSLFARFTGCEVDTLNLTFPARGKCSGSVGFKGQTEALDTSIVTGATYTAANTNAVMTGISAASMAVAGLSPAPVVRSVSLAISNGLRVRDQLGSAYTDQFGSGMCEITGQLDAYFTSNALYQKVLDHGGGAISFTIGGVANEKYTINIPSARFLNGSRTLGGRNDDVMVSIPFRAENDASSASSLVITRAVA